jgi:protein subunit release factor B
VLGVREEESGTFIAPPDSWQRSKTSSCVYLVHVPTGLSVKCQRERSQTLNRFLARRLLLDRIERLRTGLIAAERTRVEKIQRQKRRRSRRAKEKILEAKHIQSDKKALRTRVESDE